MECLIIVRYHHPDLELELIDFFLPFYAKCFIFGQSRIVGKDISIFFENAWVFKSAAKHLELYTLCF